MSAGHGHDNWHQHTAAEGVAQHAHGAQASAKALGITFLVMVFGVIATILVLIAYFNTAFSTYKASQTEGTAIMKPAFEAKLAAREQLDSYGWVDRDARTVRVPVSSAMQKVIADYQKQSANTEVPATDVQG